MPQETLEPSEPQNPEKHPQGDSDPPAPQKTAPQKSAKKFPRVSLAAPRVWHGMRFTTYLKLLWQGRFRLHFLGLGMCIAIFFFSFMNSILAMIQSLFLGTRISRTEIKQPPIFIVGHWRTGTTLVHELLNLDENLASPTTYQCFAPSHFLVSSWWLKPVIALVTPKTRPMDNMKHGPNRPQEDEFAICVLGAPSPYFAMAFPNQPKPHQGMIDLSDVTGKEKQSLADSMLFFAKSLTSKHSKRLLLKSPTHTGRIDFLRELFPGAKFLHISRDPKNFIPSTIRLWTRLDQVNGFQIPNYDESSLETHVASTFSRMYTAFNHQTQQQKDDVYSLRYEDIVENPVDCLRSFYEHFALPGFEELEPKIRSHMQQQADYQKNQHTLSDRLRHIINQNCHDYQTQYGYEKV